MNIHSPSKHVLVVPSLFGAAATATRTGVGVDCLGYERALVAFHVAAHDHTTGDETLDVKIQTSVDDVDGDYADVVGAAFVQIAAQTVTATKGLVFVGELNLAKLSRWVRPVATAAGTTPIDTYTIDVLLFDARNFDFAQTQTLAFSV